MATGFGRVISSNYFAATSLTGGNLVGEITQSIDSSARTVTITATVRPAFYRISTTWNVTSGTTIYSSAVSSSNYISATVGDVTSKSGSGQAIVTAATSFTATAGNTYSAFDGYVTNSGELAVQTASKTYSYNDAGDAISASYEFKGYFWNTSFSMTGTVTTDSISPAYTSPSISSVTLNSVGTDSANITVAGSYGTGTGTYQIEAGVAGQNSWTSPYLRSAAVTDGRTSYTVTVDNNSTQTTTLTISPNTQYYYGGYMYNGYTDDSKIQGTFVTKAVAPSVSISSYTDTSITVAYTTSADGGAYSKSIQYSTSSGLTWKTGATVSSSSATSGTYTISNLTANKAYSIRTRVSTTAGITSGSTLSVTTTASTPTITESSHDTSSITITYTVPADGGANTKTIQYSIDGGTTWVTIDTISSGSATSGTYTISGLSAGTSYTIQTRVVTSSGTTTGPTLIISTSYEPVLYGPISDGSGGYETKEVEKLYGPVTGGQTLTAVTGTIRSGGIGNVTAFDGDTFLAGVTANCPSILTNGKTLSYIQYSITRYDEEFSVCYTDGSSTYFDVTEGGVDPEDYGITVSWGSSGDDYIDLTPTYTTSYVTKEIEKLYGPVSDGSGGYVTKLIYQA